MAHLYSVQKVQVEDKHALIRPLDEEDYQVAITFNGEEDEDVVTEVLLTRAEVQDMYDLLFNK